MKSKERKTINLDALKATLDGINAKKDSKLYFELECTIMIFIHMMNINIALYGTSYYNYNFALLSFNTFFLSRRFIQALYMYLYLRDPLKRSLKFLGLTFIGISYTVTIVHSIAMLFFELSYSLLLNLVCPFIAYLYFSQGSAKSRYSEGCSDCFYSLQQILLHTLEAMYCAGYLPYKFLPSHGFIVYTAAYLNAMSTLTFVTFLLYLVELMRKRSVELNFYAISLGDWTQARYEGQAEEWSHDKNYSKGQIVFYKGEYWKAVGMFNSCEPGKNETYFLSHFFQDPLKTFYRIILIEAFFIALQLWVLTALSFHPTYVISLASLLYILLRTVYCFRKLSVPKLNISS
ncbi:unnamed protein product [Blepharisma stoltei]|uniref:Odorant receptor n=1 Tax=Blepharisma stoltei TaxID=1481888 RepID=A0AAU9JWL4_9CILI|nr:unnamed protein product [Blepharisma stoltei]